jgi:two-component system, OmpR family, sensor histidine kinase BaeS
MNSLVIRLTVGFVLLTAIIISVITFTINQTVDENFRRFLGDSVPLDYAQFIVLAERYYAETESWGNFNEFLRRDPRMDPGQGQPRAVQRRFFLQQLGPFVVTDPEYRIVASDDPQNMRRELPPVLRDEAIELTHNDEVVGYFSRQTRGDAVLAQTEQAFLDDMNNSLRAIAAGTGLFAVLLGLGLAWGLVRPLRELTGAAQEVAVGKLGTRVPVRGTTELREVATAFNQMSGALAASEQTRRQMFSDIAHELRTPISVMRGQLEGMLDGVFQRDDIQIGVIYNQNLHLSRLVNDLWTLTRAETGTLSLEKRPVQLEILLNETLQAFSALAQDEGIDLQFEAQPSLRPVRVDSGRLQQVFSNLLANAIRHTREQGRVLLKVTQSSEWTTVCVQDSGEGMTPEVAARIFNRFYRGAHGDQQGAGLGLAIARELIHLHGGKIEVESTIGVGTTFTVQLPT